MYRSYRRVEKMLYTYPQMIERWQKALIALSELEAGSDVQVQQYTEGHKSEGNISDPASDFVDRKLYLERVIDSLKQEVDIVEQERAALSSSTDNKDAEKLQVLERYYFDGYGMWSIASALGISERTLYRRRRDLIHDLMRRWRCIE